MKRWMVFLSLSAALPLLSLAPLKATNPEGEWVLEPAKQLSSIVEDEKGQVTATDKTETVTIIYLQTKDDSYRCIEYVGFQSGLDGVQDSNCYKLKRG